MKHLQKNIKVNDVTKSDLARESALWSPFLIFLKINSHNLTIIKLSIRPRTYFSYWIGH